MASIFGIPCDSPPPLGDILFSTSLFPLNDFVKSLAQNPNPSMNKHEKLFNSKVFLILYLWYIVFRIPREMSLFLNSSIALNYSILLIINISFVFELFRRYGYECTVFLVIIMYVFYSGMMYMIPVLSESPFGDFFPELKELPVSTRKPGLNHCRRLVVCRATPVYDNYLFQRGKYEKCIECAKKNEKIIFKSSKKGCGSKNRDIDAKACYECTVNSPSDKSHSCTYSSNDCEQVRMVLDILNAPEANFDRADVCKKAHGSLCWFGKLSNGKYRGWNYNESVSNYQTYELNDPRAKGHGFPTEGVCKYYMQDDELCEKGVCDVSKKEASCACSEYKNVSQFNDPCKFLEPNCDEKSIAYTEATLKIKQTELAVQDIVTVGNVDRFLKDLDTLANQLP